MDLPLLGNLSPPPTRHIIAILDSSGEGREWTLSHTVDPLGSHIEIERVGDPLLARGGCASLEETPAPILTMAEGIDRIRQFDVSAHDEGRFDYWFVPFYGHGTWRLNPPQDGWDRYSLFYVPDHVDLNESSYSYAPYYITLDAATGWLEQIRVQPRDFQGIDEPRGP